MYNNKDRIVLLLLILTLIFSLFTIFISSETTPSVSARAAALYEPETDSFLYMKNGNERLGMASTTKIMTAQLALELLDLNESIEVDKRAVGIEGSSIYLTEGEVLTAEDLVYAVLLQSANDAAAALAYKISGSIEAFALLMNEKARSLGLVNTSFTNPHGLDDKNHYTTAHDLAIISASALKNDKFKEISSTYKKEIKSSEKSRILVNHNKMLKNYDGCIGVKTGFTKKCGRCLVSAAERDELIMISVTIDAPSDWSDHKKLLDYGYSRLEAKTLAYPGEFTYTLPVLNGDGEKTTVANEQFIKRIFPKGDSDFEAHVKLSRFVTAPVREGEILGEVIFTKNGEKIASLNLVAKNTVNEIKKKKGFFSNLIKDK